MRYWLIAALVALGVCLTGCDEELVAEITGGTCYVIVNEAGVEVLQLKSEFPPTAWACAMADAQELEASRGEELFVEPCRDQGLPK